MTKNFKVTTPLPPIVDFPEESDVFGFYDPDNPDIGLFNLVDSELIRLAGSQVKYYKYYQTEEYDEVYLESRNKPISVQPIIVFCHYEPRPVEENLSQFGIEVENSQVFTFNKAYIETMVGRMPIVGDIIEPLFQKIKFNIVKVEEDSFESYGVYHLNCYAEVLRDSPDVQDTPLTETTDPMGGYGG